MAHLHQRISQLVDSWRGDSYRCERYPALSEILEWSLDPETGSLRYLRQAQFRALETYWYLRLLEGTPHVFELYKRLFKKDRSALLDALGVPDSAFKACDFDFEQLWERIRSDDDFVRDFRLESLRETLALRYSSYILALAMGAGKTLLIGAIIATEFALALEYPDGPFVQNALVFAPGKTIIESLRELARVPYDRILPPRLFKGFSASVKLTFTRDGEKDIPVVRGSSFNAIVTNTEKIRIQKEAIRRSDLGNLFAPAREEEARAEVANLRLQAIASLPHLAVFSDEAHHTYGQALDTGLKKVRRTVDYLASKTNLICVVNTTGTPYYQRQPLRDVVIWYGLSEGIRDGILKDLSGNIQAFDFSGDAGVYVSHVVRDFFQEYGNVRLPDGAPARIALYFPQVEDLRVLRQHIDGALAALGLSPTICLVNTSDEALTGPGEIDAFNRLNDPGSPHRVILLVNKGTEGWNCPSLFACALVRKLTKSNNFVLQAATRCLRQVPGNDHKARVYLSADNFGILDRQLQETYGESIADLNHAGHETWRARLTLRKLGIPPLWVKRRVRTVVKNTHAEASPSLERPRGSARPALTKAIFEVELQQATRSLLRQLGETIQIESMPTLLDSRAAAVELAARYRLEPLPLHHELRRIYEGEDVPAAHLEELCRQIEAMTRDYETRDEVVEVALALVRPQGFNREEGASGEPVYTAEITYRKDQEKLLLRGDKVGESPPKYGYHYEPYVFDSQPEMSFCEQVLTNLDIDPDEVEDLYYTGAITEPGKTDFFVEYRDDKGKWRRYTPDFIIRKKPAANGKPGSGKVLIIEIKSAQFRPTVEQELKQGKAASNEGRKALAIREWQGLDPERLRYELIFADKGTVTVDQMKPVRTFLSEPHA